MGFVASVLFGSAASAQPIQFVDVSDFAGIQPYTMSHGMGGGVVAADFDNDSDVDFFVPTAAGLPNQLYRNLGNGTFEEIAAVVGLDDRDSARVALWLDYDGDHLLDLAVAGDCFEREDLTCPDVSTLKLYRQLASGQFQDVTQAAGLINDLVVNNSAHRGGMSAGDINEDGYLDLIVSLWDGEKRLFLNNGRGAFIDISMASGLGGVIWDHHQPMMYDFDGDGFLDIYFAIDFWENQLWINQGDNTFVDEALSANLDNAMNDMGMTLGDYDRDGDLDVYVTNISSAREFHNVLLHNDSDSSGLQFVEVSTPSGVDVGFWGWGTSFFDADNDGWLDIAATNGWFNGSWANDPSRFWLSQGVIPVTFTDVSDEVGFNDTLWGSALIAFDYDRDGDLDMVQTCNGSGLQPGKLRLLENRPGQTVSAHNHLMVRPRMSGANHFAIGAVVRVQIRSLELIRLITAGTSYLGQEPSEAFFGLGAELLADSVTIEWPDGTPPTVLSNVTANQVVAVNVDTDTDGDGAIDADDPDDDNDGIPDEADCFPTNAQFWDTPGEITDLTLQQNGTVTALSWSAPVFPGGVLVAYDTLASTLADDFGAAAVCIEVSDPVDTQAIYDTEPEPSQAIFFVVRARNGCGFGPAGTNSSGAPRFLRDCL